MRILSSTNPLVGHWFAMIPLTRAAGAAGHEVVVAAGPDLVPDVERRGFAAWSVGPDRFGNAEQVTRTGSGLALGPGEASPEGE